MVKKIFLLQQNETDNYCKLNGIKNIMVKIDTEGSELNVIMEQMIF